MARPSEAILSCELIVISALRIIDKNGLNSFSMRRLASALKVAAPSIYHHFATKDDLLAEVVRYVLKDVEIPSNDSSPWDKCLIAWARSFRSHLAAHPKILPLLGAGPGRWIASLEQADAIYAALKSAGWSSRLATEIAAAMRALVVGSATGSFAGSFSEDPHFYMHYKNLNKAHLLAAQSERIDIESFELGLNAMITGLRKLHADRLSSSALM